MKIFDCHYHIPSGNEIYAINDSGRNIIFNSVESYLNHEGGFKQQDSCTVLFDFRNDPGRNRKLITENKINAWKIHSRLQKISSADYPVLIEKLEDLKPEIPLVIDAFYYGDDLAFQPDLGGIVSIAKRFPHVPVVVAHAGGYQVLRYFYHLKSIENIYFDLSFSLSYLKLTSAFMDFRNLIKTGDENRILFGTDFPFVNAADQLNTLEEIFLDLKTPEHAMSKIFYSNAITVFKPNAGDSL